MNAAADEPSSSAVPDSSEEQAQATPHFPVVGIGASAGGLEACMQLLQALPANPGMAFVVVQHLDPRHESNLVPLLARDTRMPVNEAKDRTPVALDQVYVIPPNTTLTIVQGTLRLTRRAEPRGLQSPINAFLRSLAEDRKSQAIGVILSGTGSDGTLGLKAIKGEGGITFAQDDSSKYDGMPRSAITGGCVDFILPPEGIAEELVQIGQHPYLNPALAAQTALMAAPVGDEMQQLFQLLRKATGVDFTHYKQTTLQRRLRRRMVLHKLDRPEDYIRYLQENRAELEALYQDFLIQVTNFFRDPDTFEALKTKIFPELLKTLPPHASLRIWVPGCATGEEVYSLAICLLEFLGEKAAETPIKILATDISAIDKARAGIYREDMTADVSPELLRRFFVRVEDGYQISKMVRDLCVFARHDLTRDPPFSNLDLISCRNVLIYLGAVLQNKLVPLFHYALKETGYLILGSSETVESYPELFAPVGGKHKIYARKAAPNRLVVDFTSGDPVGTEVGTARISMRGTVGVDLQKEADRIVLAKYAPAGVVVNDDLDIQQFRGQTGPYLEPAPGMASLNLLKMAREELRIEVRTAVHEAKKKGTTIRKEGLRVKTNEHYKEVTMEVIPITVPRTKTRYFVVLFEESAAGSASRAAGEPDQGPSVPGEESGDNRLVTQLQQELTATRDYMHSVIEDLEAANEELKAANEEIVSSNEELQSTNEELQTAKEELQATNEELTTVNEELHHRNQEATQLNNDLTNLLSSINIPIVMLGHDLRIRSFTPSAEKVLHLIPSDVGRPISDVKPRITIPNLDQWILEAVDSLIIQEREVQDLEGRWFSLRIRPYKTLANKIEGAVLTLIDVDSIKRGEEQIKGARDFANNIIKTMRQPLVVLDADLRVQQANRSFYQLFQVKPEETEGQRLYDLGSGPWNNPRLRILLAEALSQNAPFEDCLVEQEFPVIGFRSILLNGRRITQDGQGSLQILLALEDVTERKKADQRAVQAERLAAIGQVSAGLAHESRNALQRSQSCLELLRHEVKDQPVALNLIGRLQRAQDDLLRLYEEVRGYASTLHLHLERCDLGALVQEAWDELENSRKGRDTRFRLEADARDLHCEADPERLKQVFRNILENALSACPDPVEIDVSWAEATLEGRPALGLILRNNGPALTAEEQRRLFEAFFTTKTHGTGLGLTITKRIVEAHGGRIEVVNTPSQGVAVQITLPRGKS